MSKLVFSLGLILILLTPPVAVTGHAAESGFRFDQDRRSVTIPIKVRNNLAVMPVTINDIGPFYFILDTGVKTTILTEPLVMDLLGLDIEQTILLYGLGGSGIVEALLAKNVTIGTPGITGHNKNLIIIPEDLLTFSEVFGFPVYGIIGYDFFKNFPMRISYSNEYIRVYNHHDYRIRRRSHIIPIDLVDGKPYVKASIVGSGSGSAADTITTHLLLDMGASHPLYLHKNYAGLSENTISGFLGKGISGYLMGQIGRVDKLIIGDTYISSPLVSYPDVEFLRIQGQEIDWEGIIGGEIIKRYEVVLDYPREKVVLRPGRDHGNPFNTSLSGLEVVARGENHQKFIIHYVRPGSTGYESGIWAGDRIMAINKEPYHKLSMEDVLDELSRSRGSIVNLTLKRGDNILSVEITLREDLL